MTAHKHHDEPCDSDWPECPYNKAKQGTSSSMERQSESEQIASWIMRNCVGWSARLIADAVRSGSWRDAKEPTP